MLMLHLWLVKASSAFIQQCVTAATQHPCFHCAGGTENGVVSMPKSAVASQVRVTTGDSVALAQDMDVPARPTAAAAFSPTAPGLGPRQALCPYRGFIWPRGLMNNSVFRQRNEPSLVSYLLIICSEREEEQRPICRVLCYSPPEMADRAQQRGHSAF